LSFAGAVNGERRPHSSDAPSLLAGLLFDAQGCRFTPSPANKAGRLYRFYVERALITGEQPSRAKLRRIPATEIEILVRNAVTGLLTDSNALLIALGGEPTAADAEQAIGSGRYLQSEIIGSTPMACERLRPLLRRVVLDENMVQIHLTCTPLRSALGLPAEGHEDKVHQMTIPARVTTRGNRLKLVIWNGKPTQRERDLSLIRAIARAHAWRQRLSSAGSASIRDLASRGRLGLSRQPRAAPRHPRPRHRQGDPRSPAAGRGDRKAAHLGRGSAPRLARSAPPAKLCSSASVTPETATRDTAPEIARRVG